MSEAIDSIVTQQPGSKTYRVMTAVAYYAGWRPSEVVMLRVRSAEPPAEGSGRLDVTEADISFNAPGEPKTGPRSVPLPPVLVKILREWIDTSQLTEPDRLLFRTRNDTRPSGSNWARAWHRALESVGQKPMRIYDCRHAAANHLAPRRHAPRRNRTTTRTQRRNTRHHLRRRPRRRRTHRQPTHRHIPPNRTQQPQSDNYHRLSCTEMSVQSTARFATDRRLCERFS